MFHTSLLASGAVSNLWNSLACRDITPNLCLPLYVPFYMGAYLSLCPNFPFYRHGDIALGLTLMTSFFLDYLCEDPFSK